MSIMQLESSCYIIPVKSCEQLCNLVFNCMLQTHQHAIPVDKPAKVETSKNGETEFSIHLIILTMQMAFCLHTRHAYSEQTPPETAVEFNKEYSQFKKKGGCCHPWQSTRLMSKIMLL